MIAAPPIDHDPIPFGAQRVAETRAYAERHYGLHRARLIDPRQIVIHFTANESYAATHATFLAMRGMTGPLEVFEGNKGFMESIAGPFSLDWSRENLELVRRTSVKKYNAGEAVKMEKMALKTTDTARRGQRMSRASHSTPLRKVNERGKYESKGTLSMPLSCDAG